MPRLFVAAWPPPAVVDLLAALPRAEQPGVRWSPPEQWHVTLRFLGDTDAEPVAEALAAAALPTATASMGPRVGRLGHDVLVVPVGGLDASAAAVVAATGGLGRPPDPRPFLGHLTLARLRGRPACGLVDAPVRATWPVTSLALVESRPEPGGARYTELATFTLG